MTEKSLHEAIFSPLPPLAVHKDAVYRRVTVNNTTTRVEAFRALKKEDAEILMKLGCDLLEDKKEDNKKSKKKKEENKLSGTAIKQLPGTLKSEADAMTASILYFLHHINLVINQKLQNGHIKTSLESSKSAMRTDYIWNFYPKTGNPFPVAVLEIKAPNLLKGTEFAEAIADTGDRNKVDRASGDRSSTLLLYNAREFTQQLRRYLKKHNVQDRAIIDWNYLAIIDTDGLLEDHQNPVLARLAWFDRSREIQGDKSIHLMMLGFLYRALNRPRTANPELTRPQFS
ncbi:hypothetical protein BO94DRAFT_609147 [Aspergillus sclerotioniger CBS 115572]|uniref:Fungal-type protein kinase domain-containing protein n=1 Tax=Aspergillus sclerotioniger CBS 115572 TaxID=1450535 RepID=A0A317V913_9EURO|nr:hypothetical protein BO94DRAFT_609147 [Aspergillus sclerotioniger CBS 115572]PWY70854.1 hypothetical protein BO94DRAFT_609147 [Aspergillus sclerotioniger CBS 115572]